MVESLLLTAGPVHSTPIQMVSSKSRSTFDANCRGTDRERTRIGMYFSFAHYQACVVLSSDCCNLQPWPCVVLCGVSRYSETQVLGPATGGVYAYDYAATILVTGAHYAASVWLD